MVFSSNRPGGLGGQDIWVATRDSVRVRGLLREPGAAVNTAAAESRPSLSWDGEQLLFGRAPGPEGGSDIYVTTRDDGAHDDDDDDEYGDDERRRRGRGPDD